MNQLYILVAIILTTLVVQKNEATIILDLLQKNEEKLLEKVVGDSLPMPYFRNKEKNYTNNCNTNTIDTITTFLNKEQELSYEVDSIKVTFANGFSIGDSMKIIIDSILVFNDEVVTENVHILPFFYIKDLQSTLVTMEIEIIAANAMYRGKRYSKISNISLSRYLSMIIHFKPYCLIGNDDFFKINLYTRDYKWYRE